MTFGSVFLQGPFPKCSQGSWNGLKAKPIKFSVRVSKTSTVGKFYEQVTEERESNFYNSVQLRNTSRSFSSKVISVDIYSISVMTLIMDFFFK